MSEEKDSWGEYSKLVLKELERLNESTEKMRIDMDQRFNDLNTKISEIKNIEGKVTSHSTWIEKVNDVWSPTQMKELINHVEELKLFKTKAVTIFMVVQFGMGLVVEFMLQVHGITLVTSGVELGKKNQREKNGCLIGQMILETIHQI